MKKITALFLTAAVFLLLFTGCARKKAAILEQPDNLYVADEAGVLSAETENYVVSRVSALKDSCGGEIAIVTLDYLNDLTAEEYAYTLFNQWGIGDKQKNNGMMVLIVIGENSCWLTPGYGIEDDFPATQCTDYLSRYLWQYQNAGNCDTGVRNLTDALVAWYSDYYGVTVSGAQNQFNNFSANSGYGEPYPDSPQQEQSGLFSGSGILTLLAIGFVLFLVLRNSSGQPRKRSYFVPMVITNTILNSGRRNGYSGGHVGGSPGSFHAGTSHSGSHVGGHSGGGGSHGGGGGFKG